MQPDREDFSLKACARADSCRPDLGLLIRTYEVQLMRPSPVERKLSKIPGAHVA